MKVFTHDTKTFMLVETHQAGFNGLKKSYIKLIVELVASG
jgi:hypothetical protein